MTLTSILRKNLGIDLGTANTLVYVAGEGIVLNEPTYIELDQYGETISLGEEAFQRFDKTPQGHRVYRPLKDGVIEDFEAATALIRGFINKARANRGLFPPKVLIGIPSKMTQMEKRSVLEAARLSNIKRPYLIEETMAAAIGAGLDIFDTTPLMVVDIGGGTTEAAVIKKGGFLNVDSIRVAGDEMDYAIKRHIREHFGLHVGIRTGERIKWAIGTAISHGGLDELSFEVPGKDRKTRLPKTIRISARDLRPCLSPILEEITGFIRSFLAELNTGDRDQIVKKGIHLTGGGALLKGLDSYLEQALGLPIRLVENPLLTVVLGTGKAIEDIKTYRSVFSN